MIYHCITFGYFEYSQFYINKIILKLILNCILEEHQECEELEMFTHEGKHMDIEKLKGRRQRQTRRYRKGEGQML